MSVPHSEASKLLEAALEQMDGIIQGAKFDMAAEDFNNSNNGHAHTRGSDGVLSHALRQLRVAILNNRNGDLHDLGEDDADHLRFLAKWIKSKPGPWHHDLEDSHHPIQEKYLQCEAEKDALQLQVGLLTEQLERQGSRLNDLEQLLHAKKELLRKTETALDRERQARTLNHAAMQRQANSPQQPRTPAPDPNANANTNQQASFHYSELVHFKNRCNSLEMENQELRKLVGGNRTPKYLPLSPTGSRHQVLQGRSPMHEDSSPDESPKKEVGFTGRDEDIPPLAAGMDQIDLDASYTSGQHQSRPPRGFKKIFGKIKRSNSGGHLEEQRPSRPNTPEHFRRGGFRATTGGRLGWSNSVERTREMRKPIAEWNVDTICTWLECLGLGAYCTEVQKTIGTGEQLAKMTFNDLETKLNVKHILHRKKLYLALVAKQDTNRRDLEGNLDHQWVLRWLDDVGLPQYKETFMEARVDGRVLNILSVDDLFQLKVTNQLHHLSIRRGIQILRANNFEPNCLRRRAIPGEGMDPNSVSLWTNHRVMEWLKQVDLAEYAPNLRGSGVHGALLVFEPRFTDDLLAALLSIPGTKTLLRRHLSIHFKELVGRDVMQTKRTVEQESNFVPLTPTAKAKSSRNNQGQFTLKRKKSKAQFDQEDLVCPFK